MDYHRAGGSYPDCLNRARTGGLIRNRRNASAASGFGVRVSTILACVVRVCSSPGYGPTRTTSGTERISLNLGQADGVACELRHLQKVGACRGDLRDGLWAMAQTPNDPIEPTRALA